MSTLGRMMAGRPPKGAWVRTSADFERVAALPRRQLNPHIGPVRALTEAYRAVGGSQTLRPIQALALADMAQAANAGVGMLCPMGVGSGKTLISLLAPTVYRAAHPVLITYASLLAKTRADIVELRRHWQISERIRLLSWETLSTPAGADWLWQQAPDLVVADEAHAVKDPNSVRTRRFLRYFEDYNAALVALSGTFTTRSLSEFAHIAAVALQDGSPAPLEPAEVAQWDRALAERVEWSQRLEPGVLETWCRPNESAREGYRRRLVETPGVVATESSALGTALNITTTKAFGTPAIRSLLRGLDRTGSDPSGVELSDPKDVARVAKTLACGYYLRWQWPGDVPDHDWLGARNAWNREVRHWLGRHDTPGLDSPALLARACQARDVSVRPLWSYWDSWAAHNHKPPPPVVPRFDRSAVIELGDAIQEWAGNLGGIVWVDSPHLGNELARRIGYLHVPAGGRIPSSAPGTVILSRQAFGTGHNLQDYCRNLVLVPPASGKTWEQLLGRTHRPGQTADAVEVTVALHHSALRTAWEGALADAKYIETISGNQQKLNMATFAEG